MSPNKRLFAVINNIYLLGWAQIIVLLRSYVYPIVLCNMYWCIDLFHILTAIFWLLFIYIYFNSLYLA